MNLSNIVFRTPAEAKKRFRVSITESCNLKCFFCHGDGSNVKHFNYSDSNLNIDEINNAIKIALKVGIKKVKLTGGEPLLYKSSNQNIFHLIDKVIKLKQNNEFDLSIVSNGTLINRETANKLFLSGLDGITISLHAGSQKTFNNYASPRDINSFDSVLKGISYLVESGFKNLKLNSVIYYSKTNSDLRNVQEMKRILVIARKLGIEEVRFYVILQNPRIKTSLFEDTMVYWDNPIFRQFYPNNIFETVTEILNNKEYDLISFPGSFKATFKLNDTKWNTPTFSFQNFKLRNNINNAVYTNDYYNSQEGDYALRLLNNGNLQSSLWGKDNINILGALQTNDLIKLDSMFKEVLSKMDYLEPELVLN